MTLKSKFMHAVKIGDVAQVRKRIKSTRLTRTCADELGYHAIHISIINNHISVLKCLLDANFDIEATVNGLEPSFYTPLMIAAIENNTVAASMLISAGASINAESSYKETALFLAAERNNQDIVTLLLNADADTEISDILGYTPLLIASREGALQSNEALLNNGANPYATTQIGHNAFFWASNNKNKVAAQLVRRVSTASLDEHPRAMSN